MVVPRPRALKWLRSRDAKYSDSRYNQSVEGNSEPPAKLLLKARVTGSGSECSHVNVILLCLGDITF